MNHSLCVNDIEWIPHGREIGSDGKLKQSSNTDDEKTYQFLTIAADGKLMVWDTRRDHHRRGVPLKKKNEFKMKDAWIPYVVYPVLQVDLTAELALYSFNVVSTSLADETKQNNSSLYTICTTTQDGEFAILDISPVDKKEVN
jgi:hypothetical protein